MASRLDVLPSRLNHSHAVLLGPNDQFIDNWSLAHISLQLMRVAGAIEVWNKRNPASLIFHGAPGLVGEVLVSLVFLTDTAVVAKGRLSCGKQLHWWLKLQRKACTRTGRNNEFRR